MEGEGRGRVPDWAVNSPRLGTGMGVGGELLG